MLKTNTSSRGFLDPSQDELVTVKSDLILLARDFAGKSRRWNRKPGLQLVVNRKPEFHIDPEDAPRAVEWCSRESTLWKSLVLFVKLAMLLCLLYFFIASLNLLALSFRLIGGKTASVIFQNSAVLSNPVVGLVIGVIVTVVVQSSSTSSSIIVSMVAANFLSVEAAIPIIMGANIGTSVTNTFVSFGQVNDREQFERAFAGATVHDMFNFLCVLVLLPVEVCSGYLSVLTRLVLSGFNFEHQDMNVELLSKLTKPLTSKIVRIDKEVLDAWSINNKDYENATLLHKFCGTDNSSEPILCDHLAAQIGLGDTGTGILLLGASLTLLCVCLMCIVRILGSILKGSVAIVVERVLNADLPYVPWLTGYLAILIGAVMTFILQSSSIFTSSLIPLVGLGMISVDRVYPLTLGSNLGTTTTALLAALATEGSRLRPSIQIALVHLFFNLTGLLIFYPIPFMRIPVIMAKKLGQTTAKYRWFSVLYMVVVFILLPLFVFSVSMGGTIAMYSVFFPLLIVIFCLVLINVGQSRCPKCLPGPLRSWHWLPKPLRSLDPLDSLITRIMCCKKFEQSRAYSPVGIIVIPSANPICESTDDFNYCEAPVVVVHRENR